LRIRQIHKSKKYKQIIPYNTTTVDPAKLGLNPGDVQEGLNLLLRVYVQVEPPAVIEDRMVCKKPPDGWFFYVIKRSCPARTVLESLLLNTEILPEEAYRIAREYAEIRKESLND